MALLLILPVAAHADFLYEFQADLGSFGAFSLSFAQPTLEGEGTVTSFLTTTAPAGVTITGFAWNSAAGGFCTIGNQAVGIGGSACAALATPTLLAGLPFAVDSFLSPGTYTSNDGFATLTITDTTAVPEPASMVLLGTGLAIGYIRRKNLLGRLGR